MAVAAMGVVMVVGTVVESRGACVLVALDHAVAKAHDPMAVAGDFLFVRDQYNRIPLSVQLAK